MRQGCRHALFPPKDKQQDDDLSRQERIAAINCALEAGLCVMYVLTSPDISPSLIADNVIDRDSNKINSNQEDSLCSFSAIKEWQKYPNLFYFS